MNDCQNPLFAGALPDGSKTDVGSLCHAPPGTRTKDLVFYAHIGGVPSQLLHFTPGDSAASTLTDADWVKILGADPETYDYTGIDPHMIESYTAALGPRAGRAPRTAPTRSTATSGSPTAAWATSCRSTASTRASSRSRTRRGTRATRDCTLAQNANFCDCPHTAGSVTTAAAPPDLRSDDADEADGRQGVPDDPRAAARPQDGQAGHRLVDLPDPHRRHTRRVPTRSTATVRRSRSSSTG